MNKYVVMTGRDDVVVLNADDNKSVKAYIAKGYGITNRIKSKHPLEMSVAKIIKEKLVWMWCGTHWDYEKMLTILNL